MVKESLPSWVHQDSDEGLVHVNVGGLKRSLCSSTLKKFPDTRLGKLLACDSEEDILQVGESFSFLSFVFTPNLNLSSSSSSSSCRCVTTMTCSRRSFILTGTPASSLTSSTFIRPANSTSWRSCASSPSGVCLSLSEVKHHPASQTDFTSASFISVSVSVELVSSTSFFSFSCLKRS